MDDELQKMLNSTGTGTRKLWTCGCMEMVERITMDVEEVGLGIRSLGYLDWARGRGGGGKTQEGYTLREGVYTDDPRLEGGDEWVYPSTIFLMQV